MSRSREQDGKFSLQMVSKLELQREAKLSNITLALDYLTDFLCLALQISLLSTLLFLLSYAGSCVPNSVARILIPDAGTVKSYVATSTIAAASCICNVILRKPHLAVWGPLSALQNEATV